MKYGFTNHKCPKCGGNLYLDRYFNYEGGLMDWYDQESCLQCGYVSYKGEITQAQKAVTTVTMRSELLAV